MATYNKHRYIQKRAWVACSLLHNLLIFRFFFWQIRMTPFKKEGKNINPTLCEMNISSRWLDACQVFLWYDSNKDAKMLFCKTPLIIHIPPTVSCFSSPVARSTLTRVTSCGALHHRKHPQSDDKHPGSGLSYFNSLEYKNNNYTRKRFSKFKGYSIWKSTKYRGGIR